MVVFGTVVFADSTRLCSLRHPNFSGIVTPKQLLARRTQARSLPENDDGFGEETHGGSPNLPKLKQKQLSVLAQSLTHLTQS